MKLEIWVDGSMEIMHVFFFSPILKNELVAMATNRLNITANITIFVFSKKKLNIFIKLKIWIDGRMEIIHMVLILTIGNILRAVILNKHRQPRQDFLF
jgi:quinol-cytochrome oxidoreductase complex cytochrome b subunit